MKKVYESLIRYYIFGIVILLLGAVTTANAQPVVNAGADATICQSVATHSLSDATASGTGTLTYSWTHDGSGSLNDPAILNPVYTPVPADFGATITFTLEVNDDVGTTSDSKSLTVIAFPTVNAGSDATICFGGSYTITDASITGSFAAFVWAGGDGTFDNPGLLLPTYTPGPLDFANGNVELSLVVAPQNPCVALQSDKMRIEILPALVADAGPDATICEDETYTLSGATANPGADYLWSGGSGSFDDATLLNATYTPGVGETGAVTLALEVNTGACAPVYSEMELTINALPVVTCPADDEVCIDAAAFALAGASPAGGTYSGTGVSAGTFDPAIAGAGTHTITYEYTDGNGCTNSCTFDITVNDLPIVTCPADDEVCIDDAPFALAGASPIGGTYSGTGVSAGTFDPAAAGAGTHTITYEYTDGNGCTNSCTFDITVNALPVLVCPADFDLCVDEPLYDLSGLATPSGGDYSGTGVSANQFDASSAGVGTHTITYEYTDGNGCTNTCTFDITVNDLPALSCPLDFDLCVDEPLYDLDGLATPSGGDYSGTGVSANQFDAATAGAGTHTITYTYTDSNGCTNTCTFDITVNPLPVVTVPDDFDVCEDAADFDMTTLTPTPDPAGGIFSGSGVSGNDFSPLTAGVGQHTITYEYTDGNGCTNSDTFVIEVFPVPTVDAGPDFTICELGLISFDNASITNASLIQWAVIGGSGTFDDENIEQPVYTPAPLDYNQAFLSFFVSAAPVSPCTTGDFDEIDVYIQLLPDVEAGPDATICEDGSYTITGATIANESGQYWGTAGDGTFADGTTLSPTYYPGSQDIIDGQVELTLYGEPVDPPCTTETSDFMTLYFDYNPTVDILFNDTLVCQGTAFDFTNLVDYTDPGLIFWAPTTGDGNFDNENDQEPIYFSTLNDAAQGTIRIDVIVAAVSPCGVFAQDFCFLTFQLAPDVDAGTAQTICEDGSAVLSDATANYTSAVYWTALSGDAIFDDANLLNATYTPGPTAIGWGTDVLTLTGEPITPCTVDATSDVNITIQLLPVATAGTDATICEDGTYDLGGSVLYTCGTPDFEWSTSGDGTFTDINDLNATYTPGVNDINLGSATISLTAFACTPCVNNDTDSFELTIQPRPTVDAGPDANVCESGAFLLAATASDYSSLLWTTAGDGTFDDDTDLNPTYYPGTNDALGGSVILTLTANSEAPCIGSEADQITLTVQPSPYADAGPDATACETGYTFLPGDVEVLNNSNLEWTTNGDGAFTDPLVLVATYVPGPIDINNGVVTLTLVANPINPCVISDQDDMDLFIIEGPVANAGSDGDICDNGTFDLVGATASNYSGLLWTSSTGKGTFAPSATVLNPVFTPDPDDYGTTIQLELEALPNSPCAASAFSSIDLFIQASPTADAGLDGTLCESGGAIAGTATNESSTLWTTSGDGVFDDATLAATNYTPGSADILAGTVTLTFTAEPTSPCLASSSDDVEYTIQVQASANAGPDRTICQNVSVALMSASASDYSAVLWTSAGDGTFNDATVVNAVYNPGTADISNGSVVLTLTADDILPCSGDASDSMTLSFQLLPVANAGPDATLCEDAIFLNDATMINHSSILWTSSGDGTFSSPIALNPQYFPGATDKVNGQAVLTISGTPIFPCNLSDGDDIIVTIINNVMADAGVDDAVCETADPYTISGASASDYASILWTSTGDGTFDDATVENPVYNFGPTDPGTTITLCIEAQPINPCIAVANDCMDLSIQKLPTVFAGVDKTTCGINPFILSDASADDYSAILWETSGDGTFDDPTVENPQYIPGTNDFNNFGVVLTMTANAVTPCSPIVVVNDAVQITIQWEPEADAGADATICDNQTHALSGSLTNSVSGFWTTTGDGAFDDNTSMNAVYTPGSADIGALTVDLCLTAEPISPCLVNSTPDCMTLTIQASPSADAGAGGTVCESGSFLISDASVQNASGQFWSGGDGTFDDNTLLAATYYPAGQDLVDGFAELCLTAEPTTPCLVNSTPDCMTLAIQYNPIANAGLDASVCELTEYQITGASAQYESNVTWTSSGDGTFDDPSAYNPLYTLGPSDEGNTSVVLTMQLNAVSPCVAIVQDDMTLYIQKNPTASAGSDETVCEDAVSYSLSAATASDFDAILWTTSGDGTFSDATIENPVYEFGATDPGTTVTLTILAEAISPCVTDASDFMELTIQPRPVVDAGPDLETCSTEPVSITGASASFVGSVSWATSGDGTFDPPTSLVTTYYPGPVSDQSNLGAVITLTGGAVSPCLGIETSTFTLTINEAPVLTSVDIQASLVDVTPSWYPISGDLAGGYEMCLSGEETTGYWLDIDGLVSSELLEIGTFNPFYHTATVPGDFISYWAARGVVSGAPGWQGIMYDIITGVEPIFYIVYDGSDYMLVDGLQYQNIPSETLPLAIPGNYPQGLYTFTGTVTDENGCVSNAIEIDMTFQHAPTADAGMDGVVCETGTYTVSGASVENASGQLWTTAGDGTLTDETTLTPSYQPGPGDITNGSVDLCLVAQPISPCSVASTPDCMTIVIQLNPTVNAGPDADACANVPYQLSGSATDFSSLSWATSGNGTFLNGDQLNATYYPSADDLNDGNVTLTLSAFSTLPCVLLPTDDMLLTFDPEPAVLFAENGNQFFGGATLEYCFDDNIEITLDQIVSGVAPFDIEWTVDDGNGPVAGSATGVDLVNNVLFSNTYAPGTYTVQLTSLVDANGCSPTDISVYNVTIVVNPQPNPFFTIDGDVLAVGGDYEYCHDVSSIILTIVDEEAGNPAVGTEPFDIDFEISGGLIPVPVAVSLTGVNFDDDIDLLSYFTQTPGNTYTIQVTYFADANGCEIPTSVLNNYYNFTLTIKPVPAVLFAFNGDDAATGDVFDFCYDETIVATLSSVIAGTAPFDITIEENGVPTVYNGVDVGFEFFNGTKPAGTYTIEATSIVDADGCSVPNPESIYNLTVNVNPEPAVLFSFNGDVAVTGSVFDYCETTSVEVLLDAALVGDAPFDISWEVNTIPASASGINVGDALFNSTLTPGSYDIVITDITDANGCSVTGPDAIYYATVNIQAAPTSDAGADANTCANVPYQLSGSATNESSVFWTTSGTGTFADQNTLSATYYPSAADLVDGNVTLTLVANAISPCTSPASDPMLLTFDPEPAVLFAENGNQFFGGATLEYCYDENIEITLDQIVSGVAPFDIEWTVDDGNGPVAGSATGVDLVNDVLFSNTYAPGTYTVQLTSLVDANGCSPTDISVYNATIVVNEEPLISFLFNTVEAAPGDTFEYCDGENVTVQVGNVYGGVAPFDIEWEVNSTPASATGVNPGDVLFSGAEPAGVYTIEVTSLTDANGCVASPATLALFTTTVTVHELPALIFAANTVPFYEGDVLSYCEGETVTITLDQAITGTGPFDIAWTVDGAPDNATVNVGDVLFSGQLAAGSYPIQITSITDDNGCSPVDVSMYNATVVVSPPPALIFAANGNQFYEGDVIEYCEGDNIEISLDQIVLGDAPFDIAWEVNGTPDNATGVALDDILFSGTQVPGSYVLQITSIVDANGCSPLDVSMYNATITVNPQPALLFAANGNQFFGGDVIEYCEGDNIEITLDEIVTGTAPFDIAWTVNGSPDSQTDVNVDDVLFSGTQVPGTYDLAITSITDANGCSALDVSMYTVTIEVQALPTVNAGTDQTVCEGSDVSLTASATEWSAALWTGGAGTFDDATSLTPVYSPDASEYGTTVSLCVEVEPISPCLTSASDCVEVFIQLNPTASAGVDATICAGDTYELINATASNASGVIWISLGAGDFDDMFALNPTYTPGFTDIIAGSVELCINAAPISPCAVSADDCMTLTIQGPATLDAGIDAVICEGETHQLNATATNYSSALWSGGVGTFDDATALDAIYTPDPSEYGTTVELCIEVQPISPCTVVETACIDLFIQENPTVDAGMDQTVCEGSDVSLTASATEWSAALWTGGAGTFDDATSLTPVYTPDAGEYGTTVSLCVDVQPISPCVATASDCVDIFIQLNPTANAGDDDTVCEGEDFTLDLATAANYSSLSWSTDGDGTFDDATALNPVYTPAGADVGGSVELCLLALPESPCSAFAIDCITLTVQPAVTAFAGDDDSVCVDGSYTTSLADVQNASSLLWSSDGAGVLSDATLVNATYTPDAADAGNIVTLCVTAQPVSPCAVAASDCFELFVQGLPTVDAGGDATIQSSDTYAIPATATNYSAVTWDNGAGDGTFSDPSIINPVYTPGPNDKINGFVLLTVVVDGISPCSGTAIDNLLLTIEGVPPVVTITSPQSGDLFDTVPVLVEGTASDDDGDLDFVEVRINGGPWQLATGAANWSIEVMLDPCFNTIEARATDLQGLQSVIDIVIEVELEGQLIAMQQGWSFISSYIEAADPNLSTLADYLEPANNLIIMLNQPGKLFWPTANVNTIGDWDNQTAYKVKSNENGSWLIAGQKTANQTINLNQGVNYVPVLTNQEVAIVDYFDPNDVLIIFELQTGNIYWPGGSTFTLTDLKPGFGYLGNFFNPVTIEYPPYEDCQLKTAVPQISTFVNESPWQFERTPSAHFISITDEAVSQLDNPQFIGAFDAEGNCIGYADVRTKATNYTLVVHGDEGSTAIKDGALAGESIQLVAYNGTEEELAAQYDKSMPNYDGKFALYGMSLINSFKATSTAIGINDDLAEMIQLFPNPANDVVNIYHPFATDDVDITFTNSSGSVVLTQQLSSEKSQLNVSNLRPGVYFVKFESEGNVVVKRLVIR
jgi:hypothetical protein